MHGGQAQQWSRVSDRLVIVSSLIRRGCAFQAGYLDGGGAMAAGRPGNKPGVPCEVHLNLT